MSGKVIVDVSDHNAKKKRRLFVHEGCDTATQSPAVEQKAVNGTK